MSVRLVIAIVTTLAYEFALVAAVLWGLPRLGINVPPPVLIVLMVILGTWAVITYRKGSQALGRREVSGLTSMVGTRAKVVKDMNPEGMVKIKGELWAARTSGEKIEAGEKVIVIGQEGLQLIVQRDME